MNSIAKLIIDYQNKYLNLLITMEEVEEAVRDMPNEKDPGPDGFTINFYTTYWEIVNVEVSEVVEDSWQSSSILKSLNSSFITVIPKEE